MGLALFDAPAWWGLLGAFVYAGPRLSACVFAAAEHKAGSGRCFAEFFIAMATGAIAAAAWGPTAQQVLRHDSPEELRAICSMIGLVANRTAPLLIDGFSGALAGRLGKLLRGDDK